MSLIINIYYTGENGSARKFANEMISSGIVDKVRKEEGKDFAKRNGYLFYEASALNGKNVNNAFYIFDINRNIHI